MYIKEVANCEESYKKRQKWRHLALLSFQIIEFHSIYSTLLKGKA